MRNRIRELRASLKMNQNEFGAAIGRRASAVGNWERGVQPVPESAVNAICLNYGVARAWLERGEGEMFVPKAATTKREATEEFLSRLIDEIPTEELRRKALDFVLSLVRDSNSVSKSQTNNGTVQGDMIQR